MTPEAERVWCGLDERAAQGLVNEALMIPPELVYDTIVRRCRQAGHWDFDEEVITETDYPIAVAP